MIFLELLLIVLLSKVAEPTLSIIRFELLLIVLLSKIKSPEFLIISDFSITLLSVITLLVKVAVP